MVRESVGMSYVRLLTSRESRLVVEDDERYVESSAVDSAAIQALFFFFSRHPRAARVCELNSAAAGEKPIALCVCIWQSGDLRAL